MDEQEEIRHLYNARPNMNERDRRSTRNINIRQANNFVKACLIKKYIRPHDRVLDLGVGKGGDFAKYKSSRISELYGLDIANRSILDAVERAREGNYPFKIVLKTRDTYARSSTSVGSSMLFQPSSPSTIHSPAKRRSTPPSIT